MKTIFVIGSKKHTLKYTRKMPEGEVKFQNQSLIIKNEQNRMVQERSTCI